MILKGKNSREVLGRPIPGTALSSLSSTCPGRPKLRKTKLVAKSLQAYWVPVTILAALYISADCLLTQNITGKAVMTLILYIRKTKYREAN